MAYRILHIADVHLDMAFTGGHVAAGNRRREQLRDAFEHALRLGRERDIDAVCIAGDLYEEGRSGPDRAEYLRRVLGDLSPTRVFISPGNHDPYTPASLYRRIAPLPSNVFVFGTRAFAGITLGEGITLWGFGHERELDRDPAIGAFRCEGAGTHLLLFHGSDRDAMPPGKDAVAPFTSADIQRTGASHAMLGHFHGLLQRERYAYPGSLEPLNYWQDGRHTASIVSIHDGRVSAEFLDVNRVRYAEVSVDVSAYGDRAALVEALNGRLAAENDAQGFVFCRVHLTGELQPSVDLEVAALESELDDRFGGVTLVEDFAAFDYDQILREGRTVRAEFIRAMHAKMQSASADERTLLERALRYGMLAFARKTVPT